MSRFFFSSEQT